MLLCGLGCFLTDLGRAVPTPVKEEVFAFQALATDPIRPSKGRLTLVSDGYLWGTTLAGGPKLYGTIYKIKPDGTDLTVVHSFPGPNSTALDQGKFPDSGLVATKDRYLWGTTTDTIYKIHIATGELTTVYKFTGAAAGYSGEASHSTMIIDQEDDNVLWGTNVFGGEGNFGSIYKLDRTTEVLTTVVEFTGMSGDKRGEAPKGCLLDNGDGYLWGTTYEGGSHDGGTIFKVQKSSGTLTTVVDFPQYGLGRLPTAGLVKDINGLLWGTTLYGGTSGHGTLFKLNPVSGAASPVVEFADPGVPFGELAYDGKEFIWGKTQSGGTENEGTVFKVSTITGARTTVLSFGLAGENVLGFNPAGGFYFDPTGVIWGTANKTLTDWSLYPVSKLIVSHSTIFRIDSETGKARMTTFNLQVPRTPAQGLTIQNGMLWGATSGGGRYDSGTIFKVNPRTNSLTTVTHIAAVSNYPKYAPATALTSDGEGNFWGCAGNDEIVCSIYKLNSTTGEMTVVYTFDYRQPQDGRTLNWPLLNYGEFMWGVTSGGYLDGNYYKGTLFKIHKTTGQLTTLVRFSGSGIGSNGKFPNGGLCADGNGFLWGTTSEGGENEGGTIFRFEAATGIFQTMAYLRGPVGSLGVGKPIGPLMRDTQGNLWGTSENGASGTVFKFSPSEGKVTRMLGFPNVGGGTNPASGLLDDGMGSFWGTTRTGTNPVFRFDSTTGQTTQTLPLFDPASGPLGDPGRAQLVYHAGNIYGTTETGGSGGAGTIYRLRFGPTPETLPVIEHAATYATARGTVNPNGSPTTAIIQYGTDPALLTSSSAPVTLPTANTPTPIAIGLQNLTPGTTYFYRVQAENANQYEPQVGETLSFTTNPALSPFEHWMASFPNGTGCLPVDDMDGDQLPNMVEFAFGSDPTKTGPSPVPQGSVVDGKFEISFSGVNGVNYLGECSPSLTSENWTRLNDTGSGTAHRFVMPLDGSPRMFFRFRISVETRAP